MRINNIYKRVKLSTISFFLIFAIFFVSMNTIGGYAAESKNTSFSNAPVEINDSENNVTLSNEKLLFSYDKISNSFTLTNKASGVVWTTVPENCENDQYAAGREKTNLKSVFTMTYFDPEHKLIEYANTFNGAMKTDENGNDVANIQVVVDKDSIIIYYIFFDIQIIVPVRFYLNKDSMVAEILTSQIVEQSAYKVMTITLLPNFGAGTLDEAGYVFIPDGSGALIEFNNNKSQYDYYQQKVYGRDESFDILTDPEKYQTVRLPVFGMSKASGGFLGVITQGESLAEIRGTTNKQLNSYSTVCSVFNIRSKFTYTMGESNPSKEPERVDVYEEKALNKKNDESLEHNAGNVAVEYFILDSENCDYNAMALKYREYLTENLGLEKAASSAALHIEFPGASDVPWQLFGMTMYSTKTLNDFDDITNVTNKFLENGVEEIKVKYSDWSKAQLQDDLLKKAKVLSRLGGNSALKDFVKENDKVSLYLESDFYSVDAWPAFYSKSNNSANNLSGKDALVYTYEMVSYLRDPHTKPSYLISSLKLNEIVEKFTKSLNKLDGVNVSVTNMTEKLYSDYTESGYTRQQSLETVQQSLNTLSENKKLMASGGNAYALASADCIVNSPYNSSELNSSDKTVPFYQIALSGLKEYSYKPINFATDSDELFLKSIETGANIHLYFIMQNVDELDKSVENSKHTSVNPDNWYDKAIEYYKGIEAVKNASNGTSIVAHSALGADVYETKYENGCRVVVNYNDSAVTVDGVEIEGAGYKIFSGGER